MTRGFISLYVASESLTVDEVNFSTPCVSIIWQELELHTKKRSTGKHAWEHEKEESYIRMLKSIT